MRDLASFEAEREGALDGGQLAVDGGVFRFGGLPGVDVGANVCRRDPRSLPGAEVRPHVLVHHVRDVCCRALAVHPVVSQHVVEQFGERDAVGLRRHRHATWAHCERCGHEWIVRDRKRLPKNCARSSASLPPGINPCQQAAGAHGATRLGHETARHLMGYLDGRQESEVVCDPAHVSILAVEVVRPPASLTANTVTAPSGAPHTPHTRSRSPGSGGPGCSHR